MAQKCKTWAEHSTGRPGANGNCKHPTAESMPRSQIPTMELVCCDKCGAPLGRVCPDCHRWY